MAGRIKQTQAILHGEGMMNIGIFVNSRTGNTHSVAEKLRDRLVGNGHAAVIEKVISNSDIEMNPENVVLVNPPSTNGYDMLVFAAPVYGSRLPAVMQVYLQSLPTLDGKLLAGFVTQAFPFASMGGNQAIKGLEKLVQAKDGKLRTTSVVNWMFRGKRAKQIAETVEKIAGICP